MWLLLNCVDVLKELIKVRSFSGREGEAASLIKDYLSAAGVDKVFFDRLGNVIAEIKGGGSGVVVLEGHMDVVDPGDLSSWRTDPFTATLINGRVYGRGAVDMKGAIAAQILAISMLRELDVDVYAIYTTHEETAEGVAFKHAITEGVGRKPDVVVIGEATSLNLGIGHRGRAVIEVSIFGLSAHASMPQEGINALVAAAEIITEASKLTSRLGSHPKLGAETVVPTIIKCNSESPPRIPDFCEVLVDVRVVTGTTEESLVSRVQEVCEPLLRSSSARAISVRVREDKLKFWTGAEVVAHEFFPAWLNTNRELIEHVLSAVRTSVNPGTREYVWSFSTDGVYSAGEAGIETVGFGPGDERLAHKPNEYVSIKELEKAVKGYVELVKALNRYINFR